MKAFKIGQVAKQVNLTVEGVRFYEKLGLIPNVKRSESGHRVYYDDSVGRLKFIRQMQDLGFQLDEIRELLSSVDENWEKSTLLGHALDEKIAALETDSKLLKEAKDLLQYGSASEPDLSSTQEFFQEFQKIYTSIKG